MKVSIKENLPKVANYEMAQFHIYLTERKNYSVHAANAAFSRLYSYNSPSQTRKKKIQNPFRFLLKSAETSASSRDFQTIVVKAQ